MPISGVTTRTETVLSIDPQSFSYFDEIFSISTTLCDYHLLTVSHVVIA